MCVCKNEKREERSGGKERGWEREWRGEEGGGKGDEGGIGWWVVGLVV